MKKLLFFFLLAVTVASCSLDEGNKSQEYLISVEDATVPETMTLGQVADIVVKYRKPTDCHIFNGFYTQSDGYTQTISVRCLKFSQGNCMNDSETVYAAPLNFTPTTAGTYHFKFWNGEDVSGQPTYLEFDSVVE